MIRQRLMHVLVASLTVSLAGFAFAGPPLLCHQIQIADAKSLPWGKDTFDKSAKYDAKNVVDDTLELLTPELPVLGRMETLRRATLYIERDVSKADRLLGALLTRTLDAEVVMDPKTLALRYFDAGYLAATFQQSGVHTSFGPVANGNKLHAEMPGYPWLVRAWKLSESNSDMALAIALVTADTRMSEHTMFLESAAKSIAANDEPRSDLLEWIGKIRGTTLEAIREKYPPAHVSSQH